MQLCNVETDSLAQARPAEHRGSKTKCRLPMREAFDGQHVTRQAEAANGPTHATESPAVQSGLASSFRFVSRFVSVIPVFTTTPLS